MLCSLRLLSYLTGEMNLRLSMLCSMRFLFYLTEEMNLRLSMLCSMRFLGEGWLVDRACHMSIPSITSRLFGSPPEN